MITDIIKGVSYCIDSIRDLFKVWALKYVILSGILSLIVFGAFMGGIYFWGSSISDGIMSQMNASELPGFIDKALDWIFRIVLWLGVIFIFKYIVLIVTAPFMGALSEATEKRYNPYYVEHRTGIKTQVYLIARGTRLAISNIIREIFITIPLMLLSFIPALGLIPTALIFVIQAYYAGFGNFDFMLERYFDRKNSRQFVYDNKGLSIGIGGVFLALFFIPIIGPIIAPSLATIASTKAGIKRLDH